ncbi:MAG: DUF1311 domain-containing protein [Magnetococcales bacterium]|nr:DUF1311 domain-containing protein [Magnetococcales bacterium]
MKWLWRCVCGLACCAMVVPLGPTQARADANIAIDCAKPMGTVEEKYCTGEAYRAADADLNQSWATFTSGLEPGFKQALIEAQRAWVTYRDRNCDAETFLARGGTGYISFYNLCLERMTRQRTEVLRTLLEPN